MARLDEPTQTAMKAASSVARMTASAQPVSMNAMAGYEELCRTAIFGPAQSALWVSNWVSECKPDAIIATLYADNGAILALPLEVVSIGPFRVAQFMGGRHANGNFPATALEWLPNATPRSLIPLLDAISRSRSDIDVVTLDRLLPELDRKLNPLLAFPSFNSPNVSLAGNLSGGFDATLERFNGNSKRRKYRSQSRKFDAAGPYRRIEAKTPDETRALLDAFFAMKEARFRKAGIANVFADARVRAFFYRLFASALTQPVPRFMLHGLEVAGKFRAITGSSRCENRLICEFGSIADDDLASVSPGGFLFFENIREACEQGFAIYDFSVGDEPYKRQWCDIEIQHAEVLLPLTLKGHAFAFGLQLNAKFKAYVKSRPAIWNLMKLVRRKMSSRDAKPAKETD